MAITFRGSCATQYMTPTPNSDCFVIENSARSMSRVNILKMVMQIDTGSLSSGTGNIMPLLKVQKVVGSASGGIILTGKAPWDTNLNAPDSGVMLRLDPGFYGANASDITISGTRRTMGQQFAPRLITGAEQFQSADLVLVDPLASGPITLVPGELLTVQWSERVTATGGTAFLQLAWEEDGLGTEYTISGNATLDGSPVSGAKILVVTDLDRDLPNPQVEVITTGAPGTWSKVLAAGVKASVFSQYRNGETIYTDEGKPFIGP